MSMERDKISRKAFTPPNTATVSALLSMNIVNATPLPPRTRQTIPEREADVVLLLTTREGKQFILHLEFQTTNDPKMAIRMLTYDAFLHAETGLEVLGMVIYIGQQKLNMKNKINFHGMKYSCRIIDIRTLDPQLFINSDNPREVLYALLAGPDKADRTIIIQTILHKLQELLKHSPIELAELVVELEYLGQIKSRSIQQQIKTEVSHMPIILDKKKSLFYQEAHRLGKKEGIIKGVRRGELIGERRGELSAKRSNALNFMREGVSLDIISRSTGLSMDELLDLRQSLE